MPGPSAEIQARRRKIQNFPAQTVRPDFNYSHSSPSETTEPAISPHPCLRLPSSLYCSRQNIFQNVRQCLGMFLDVSLRGKQSSFSHEIGKGAFVSESALHSFDGDKPNSVGSPWRPDDHSSHPSRSCGMNARSRRCGTVMRRYPRINRAGCPSSVLSCTAWGFSCLAHYSASGELLPRLFTLACAFLKEPAVCFL